VSPSPALAAVTPNRINDEDGGRNFFFLNRGAVSDIDYSFPTRFLSESSPTDFLRFLTLPDPFSRVQLIEDSFNLLFGSMTDSSHTLFSSTRFLATSPLHWISFSAPSSLAETILPPFFHYAAAWGTGHFFFGCVGTA